MNRKLRHTSLALSATAMAFLLLLIAASPVGQPVQPAGMAPALALVATDASEPTGSETTGDADLVQDVASHRRHLRHSRALLALPYFSFAQGLRRNRS